ncbi:uncharacterized protein LOC117812245 [Notolabrus celidotus]|uniref:uncharacterized protein LOC117812245 n=1 Tax=Notolabrus celidotus TaxID=1203425 RepID=UPI00148F7E93|nr:uncharacterized protein LOC117812245 [Notolabrus celidotus]
MSKTKTEGDCPICGKLLQCVSKHLREIHLLKNGKERAILNLLATGRIHLGGGTCPIQLCNATVLHLEKHICGHKDVTQRHIKSSLKALKRHTAIQQLAALRASCPNPPMLSRLDLEEDPHEGEDGCQDPACVHVRQQLAELKREVLDLRTELKLLRHQAGEPGPAPQQAGASVDIPPPPPPPPPQQDPAGATGHTPPQKQGPTPQGASVPALPGQKRAKKLKHLAVEVEEDEQGQQQQEEEHLRVEEEEATPAACAFEESWSEEEGQSEGVRAAIENIVAEQTLKGQSPKKHTSTSQGPETVAATGWKGLKSVAKSPKRRASEAQSTKKRPSEQAIHNSLLKIFGGKSKASRMRNISFPSSMESYLEDYSTFIFCPEGTDKMQQNAVSKASRARAFIKYMMVGWEQTNFWTWEFLLNTKHLKAYPAVLRKFGWAPPTVILYLGHAISFMEYFRDTPPQYCRLGASCSILIFRDLKKIYKDVSRTVLGHQTLIKQDKQGRLVAKESLATCQRLAKAKIPSLLGKAVFGGNHTYIHHCADG